MDEFVTAGVEVEDDRDLEKLYVVCRQCGEAFDDITIAYAEHIPGECGSEQGWDILPESEAF